MAFAALLRKSLTPLLVLNIAAMVGSGVWLVTQGFLGAVWPPALVFIFSPIIFPLLLLPSAFFAGIMHIFREAKPRVSKVMAFLSVAYLVAVFTFYVTTVFRIVSDGLGSQLGPTMVYGIAAAMAPWCALAAKDRDNLFFTGLVWMTQVTAIIVIFCGVGMQLRYWDCVGLFAAVLSIMVLMEALCEKLFPAKTAAPVPPPVS